MPADDPLTLTIEGLRYALDRAPERGGGKVVVTVSLDGPDGVPLRDRADLYSLKQRQTLGQRIADAFGRQARDASAHLNVLLDQVERARSSEEAQPAMSEERRQRAERLLERPDLLEQAGRTMEVLGYVGERRTKRLAYLVATSRLLPAPLSAIVLAPSGSGKSELLDVVAKLMPPAAVEPLSRITASALYYRGPDALRHKLLLVDEQAGSAEADYAVRTLQSQGYLRLALPGQDGQKTCEVHGPIALMSGTTSTTINPENLSRCLQLTLDDSPEQTRRIQAAQRRAWTGRGGRSVDAEIWRDAQELLEPLRVVIPYAERLTFPARTTHDRRGNQKLLGLIAAHALLYQRQRERAGCGKLLIASTQDYAQVHKLLAPTVEHDLAGLSPRAARAYRLLASESCGPLSRRELAERLGWGYNTAKRALVELEEQELASVTDRGPPAVYRLLDASVLGSAGQLARPEDLEAGGA